MFRTLFEKVQKLSKPEILSQRFSKLNRTPTDGKIYSPKTEISCIRELSSQNSQQLRQYHTDWKAGNVEDNGPSRFNGQENDHSSITQNFDNNIQDLKFQKTKIHKKIKELIGKRTEPSLSSNQSPPVLKTYPILEENENTKTGFRDTITAHPSLQYKVPLRKEDMIISSLYQPYTSTISNQETNSMRSISQSTLYQETKPNLNHQDNSRVETKFKKKAINMNIKNSVSEANLDCIKNKKYQIRQYSSSTNILDSKYIKSDTHDNKKLYLATLPGQYKTNFLETKFCRIYKNTTLKTLLLAHNYRQISTSSVLRAKKKKTCYPKPSKPDPCKEPKRKPKKCFKTKAIRLPPIRECTPFPKLCPPPEPCVRADDCLCVKNKPLPPIKVNDCVCHEPYMPTKSPKQKRLKFLAPDPPRICPPPPCPQPRADDNLLSRKKKLPVLWSKDCPCVEPQPVKDVKLKRLKKCCPEEVCWPKRVCPKKKCPPRADKCLKQKKKNLPTLTPAVCPCLERTFTDVLPLKRLNLKFPEPPRPCPKPECPPRADDKLASKKKSLPTLWAKDCPCIKTKQVDWKLKRLKCRKYSKPCFLEDPCKKYPPRADMGCWEYWVKAPDKPCKKHKLKCKRKKKKICCPKKCKPAKKCECEDRPLKPCPCVDYD